MEFDDYNYNQLNDLVFSLMHSIHSDEHGEHYGSGEMSLQTMSFSAGIDHKGNKLNVN